MATVLVVDGERAQFNKLQTILDSNGYRALWSGSPSEAVRLAHQQPPGLILLDHAAVGMDVSDVMMVLRQDPSTTRIPLLLLCDGRAASLAACLDSEADMVLQKPVDPDEMMAVVERLVGNGSS